ncbi:MAG: glycosyltransferase [Verrucomicrobia bacterium]|nr:glycosyltransferase [Verrucomicrobiota bacterium]
MNPKQQLRILWLKTGPLHPLDTGGKIRTYNMLRQLKSRNEVHYLALSPEGTDQKILKLAGDYSQKQFWIPWKETSKRSPKFFLELAMNLFSRLPYVIVKYQSGKMADRIAELDRFGNYDLIICDFLTPSINLFQNGKTKTPVLLFQHNVESVIWKRLFEKASNPLKKTYFRNQWRRMLAFEKEASQKCDGVVAVSEEDARLFREELVLNNVLGAVPTGVDVKFFSQVKGERKTRSIVFLGSMDWMPNIDAVEFFASEIFPLVKQKYPETKFTIVGRNPPEKVRRLAAMDPDIHVTGTVDDVRPFVAEAEVMIVPLRVGGGTRIKIFEAMASGIPVVSTAIGAEGLPVNHGEHILLADSPEDFSKCIGQLFESSEQRELIGKNGLALVSECFGWEAVNELFEDYCRQTCQSRKDQN